MQQHENNNSIVNLNYSSQRIFIYESIFPTCKINANTLDIVKSSIIKEIYFAMYVFSNQEVCLSNKSSNWAIRNHELAIPQFTQQAENNIVYCISIMHQVIPMKNQNPCLICSWRIYEALPCPTQKTCIIDMWRRKIKDTVQKTQYRYQDARREECDKRSEDRNTTDLCVLFSANEYNTSKCNKI